MQPILHGKRLSIETILWGASASLFVLGLLCFMVYTTEQNYTFAEDSDSIGLGYDITSANASVTVGTACTLTSTVTAPHTATIANGINSTDIGTTVLNTKCNDTGGYALYAIGYTGNEYGATDLAYTSLDGTTTNSNYNIPTGTATSGSTSNWSMKLSQVPGTTPATIENGYNNYSIIPDDYTLVATLNTVTDSPSTSTPTGSSVSTTYQAYISPTQPAGTYTGKVKYTLVHPSTAPAPEKPMTIEQAYQKSGATKTAQGYYRMQDMDSSIVNRNIIEGDSIQLQDIRDDKIYWVTKMKDGNIWMTQNLDLDLNSQTELTPANTNISANWTPVNSTIAFTSTTVSGWSSSNTAPYSADPGDVCYYSSGTTSDDERYTPLTDCQTAHPDCSMHNHAGNYYNWSAAVTSNDTSSMTTNYNNAPDSICPAGWRLPVARDSADTAASREWNALLYAEGVASSPTDNGYTSDGFNKIRTVPLWLARSGTVYNDSLYETGYYGYYWSSTVYDSSNAYMLSFNSGNVYPALNSSRDNGYSVRCIAQ